MRGSYGMSTLGTTIKKARESRGMSIDGLAEKLFAYDAFRETSACRNPQEITDHLIRIEAGNLYALPDNSQPPFADALGRILGADTRNNVHVAFALEHLQTITSSPPS